MVTPLVRHCPYCGCAKVVTRVGVLRCLACRAVFFVSFFRFARKSPQR